MKTTIKTALHSSISVQPCTFPDHVAFSFAFAGCMVDMVLSHDQVEALIFGLETALEGNQPVELPTLAAGGINAH